MSLLGELVLKIPWSNLYTGQTSAYIRGVYLLVVPDQAVAYDPDKERQAQRNAKLAKLEEIETKKKESLNKSKTLAFQNVKTLEQLQENKHYLCTVR